MKVSIGSRRPLAICLWACCLVLLASCQSVKANPAPEGGSQGFYTSGQIVEGGKPIQDANLYRIQVEERGDDSIVTLRFATGNSQSSERLDIMPPPFVVSTWESPERLCIELSGVAYWEYNTQPEWAAASLVSGIIRSNVNDDQTCIVIQLQKRCEFSVSSREGALEIKLHPQKATEPKPTWVISTDLSGTSELLPDYLPSLSADGVTQCFVSLPFESEERAITQAARLREVLLLPENSLHVVVLDATVSLPDFTPPGVKELANTPAIIESQNASSELMLAGGRFLCSLPNSDNSIFAFPVLAQGEGFAKEKLYLLGKDHHISPILEYEIDAVLAAKVSSSGKILGIIEQNESSQIMTLIDLQTHSVTSVADQGFGSITSAFAFGKDDTLYGIAGDETLQLKTYDHDRSADEPAPRVNAVEERPAVFGPLDFWRDELLYLGEDGDILAMNPNAGRRRSLTKGSGFCIAPAGDGLAITEYEEDGEDAQTRLSVMLLPDGKQTVLSEKWVIGEYLWSHSGQKLYYTLLDQIDANYPFSLWCYEVQSGRISQLGRLPIGALYAGASENELILVRGLEQENGLYPVTMRICFNEQNHGNK